MTNVSINDAQQRDADDPLRGMREHFLFPSTQGEPDVYFVGNSLGLQPKHVSHSLNNVLDLWHHSAVAGHFQGSESATAWMDLPFKVSNMLAPLVGATADEVVVMNTLTVNLHLMMASFYRPSAKRCKILIEQHAFPSDHQAVHSFLQLKGIDPNEALVTVPATADGFLFDTDAVLDHISTLRDELALVLLPGVQYYTGQVLDIATITHHARNMGIPIGWDLAHAVGNIPLELGQWGPDFACWCTYKYLNGGPGSLGGCFVRADHAGNTNLNRLAGWWGHERKTRFEMRPEFVPEPNAQGWQVSNPPILALAAMEPSLELFHQAGGMIPLRRKSLEMGQFFRQCLQQQCGDTVRVLTPNRTSEHGCQLSLEIHAGSCQGRAVYDRLGRAQMHTDWREPNVIRAAPVPLYNSFQDIKRFVDTLSAALNDAASFESREVPRS